jgi:hypothetical protein
MIPLPTMLSHALVAWTTEVDNAFELRMPHRTTAMRRRGDVLHGPWLVSFPMYVHCVRHLTEGGLTVGELKACARVGRPVSGLDRWGYLVVSDATRKSSRMADSHDAIVRPTAAGLQAQAVWASLPDDIDARWNDRHGELTLSRLREALGAVVAAIDAQWPDYLPGVRGSGDLLHHVRSAESLPDRRQPSHPYRAVPPPDPTELPLYALLSKVLLAFALEYEHDAELSILLAANLVRVLDGVGVPIADLPRLVGASKEAIALSLTVATRGDLVAVEKTPGKRNRQAWLTPRGVVARERHLDLTSDIESRWAQRFGADVLRTMRSSLEAIVVSSNLCDSPLAPAYGPPPGTWRADSPTPERLPHYPLLVRGGGFPDGA